MKRSLFRASKALSKFLRHAPADIGLTLQPGGWVEITDLLVALNEHAGLSLTRAELDEIVRDNDKQRFALSEDGLRIRASQGHTIDVDLQLKRRVPPNVLYHGTGDGAASIIEANGIEKMRRTHVHLSADPLTAKRVGSRHGQPVVFEIDAARMYADGVEFFCSDNGVWLVERVAAQYLRRTA